MAQFNGKTVLITGGNSGIGLACAFAFSIEGARVVITGRDRASLEQARKRLRSDALALHYDTAQPGAEAALHDALAAEGVRLDAAFMNAGVAKFAPIESVDLAHWQETFDANTRGPYFAIQALIPLFNPGASIVLNGSINARIGAPGSSVYSASKAAVISLARTLSAELLSRGIRVNVVSPGPITTPLYERLGVPPTHLPHVIESIAAQVPLKRFGTPDELASAVVYLASPASAFVVGSEFIVDGGMSQL